MNAVISPVVSKRDMSQFIRCQWNFYRNDSTWVPPMIMDRKKLLNVEKNPFYRHSKMRCFLAKDGNEIVGRIAAIVNDNHNATHNDKVGFFGFFECVDNQHIADLLLDAAAAWLRNEGMNDMRGPVNPSLNDECGLLVEGHNSPAVVLMTYNPQYYENLLEQWGLKKEKDLYAYLLEQNSFKSEKMTRLVDLVRERSGIVVRPMNFKNKKQFAHDVKAIKEMYNKAWEHNWGFVKMTDEEFDFLAADLKQIADPNLVLIAEIGGVPSGFSLALPDINQCLIHNRSGGLLGGLWHLLTKQKRINLARIIVLGVLPEYRKSGMDTVLYYETGLRAAKRGIQYGEASWILEDNEAMNRAATQTMRGKRYKTYRIYQKAL